MTSIGGRGTLWFGPLVPGRASRFRAVRIHIAPLSVLTVTVHGDLANSEIAGTKFYSKPRLRTDR